MFLKSESFMTDELQWCQNIDQSGIVPFRTHETLNKLDFLRWPGALGIGWELLVETFRSVHIWKKIHKLVETHWYLRNIFCMRGLPLGGFPRGS